MPKFRFLPNIATADIAFETFGENYNELFENAGLALESVMVDMKTLNLSETKKLKLQSNNLENLLLSFLEELIFLKDAEELLINSIECKVQDTGKSWVLVSKLAGEKINRQKHKLGVDVKAVTKHLFKIQKLKSGKLRCQIILDV